MTEVTTTVRAPLAPLWAALAAARREVQPVERDGQSEGTQRYSYASAQAILAAGTPLLAKHGLCIVPTEAEVLDEDRRMMRRHFLLVHDSGAQHPISVEIPVVIVEYRNGGSTARDKAALAARTAALRSVYRDVLGLPAVERSEEPENREEEHQRGRGPRTQAPKGAPKPPRDDAPPTDVDMGPRETPTDPRRVKTLGELRNAARWLGLEAFEQLATLPSGVSAASTAELLAALERVRPAAAEKKAAAEAKRIAREAEEEARAARALQDAAELGEGKGAPVEPEAKGGAADDFEGRAAAVVARVKAGLAMEGSAS